MKGIENPFTKSFYSNSNFWVVSHEGNWKIYNDDDDANDDCNDVVSHEGNWKNFIIRYLNHYRISIPWRELKICEYSCFLFLASVYPMKGIENWFFLRWPAGGHLKYPMKGIESLMLDIILIWLCYQVSHEGNWKLCNSYSHTKIILLCIPWRELKGCCSFWTW